MSNGTIKAISHKNRSVLIETVDSMGQNPTEGWSNLAENIKTEWLRKGPCDFKEEGGLITFCKCTGPETPAFGGGYKKPFQPKPPFQTNKFEVTPETKRMSALKSASQVYMGTGQEEEFKELTKKCMVFLEEGMWVKEPITKSEKV